ncbi:HAMP domain-containing protein [Allopusillimonas soli]|uniref:histidine kinase n=1 Tax=Allopusillimonas soli TaxID=659016 RepID=A0A853FE31_9BURK|nr:HAMP domain-containing sensor histidine kinase [Allopusillimonas soli]NYT36761.1 HAMP domain-containing protein [Allopusillimonas soli]TEA75233.1 HAMP domain-containing protein [Allopusillimonas soli]
MSLWRPLRSWRRLWGSVVFRLTLNYGLLAAGITIIVLLVVYTQVASLLQAQFARQISSAAQRLVSYYDQNGPQALYAAVTELLSDQTDVETEMYLLLDAQGNKLAGNLDALSTRLTDLGTTEAALVPVLRAGTERQGYLRRQALDNGWTLIVGHDVRDLRNIKQVVAQAMLLTAVVGLFLVLGGTWLFRRALARRVGAIRDTARRVGTGELARRIPTLDDADEFAALRGDINQMLDHIEALMNGVRNVSDSVAHNLRTPLARVLADLHKVQDEELDRTARRAAVEKATQEIMDLIGVTERLLLIAEAESGVRRQSFQPVSLDDIVDDVVELFEPLAGEHGIVLTRQSSQDINADAAQAWADQDLLAGVVVNVVENALKYAGTGAQVRIGTAVRERHAILTIQDDGPGVPPEHRSRLGTRFYRLDSAARGFGLGLASVKAIVSLHEGSVRFEDAQPGLRVVITLPRA